jgi:type II secretory pathway component PulF
MQYAYKVSDTRGRVRTGRLEADSREQLIARLKGQGQYPLEVKAEGNLEVSARRRVQGQGLKQQERLGFTQQLAGLLAAGISIERALNIMSRLANNSRVTMLIQQLKQALQEGHSFTAALEKYPQYFPSLYTSMARAGEAGGILAPVLKRLAQYQEEELALRRFVVSSLTYPALIAAASLVAVFYFVGDVIPKFQGILAGMGQELPLITQIVLTLGTGFRNYWWVLGGLVGLPLLWLLRYLATPAGRFRLDGLKLKLPLLGDLLQKVAISKMAMALSLLTKSGVPLLTGLKITSEIVGNTVLAKALREAEREVKAGNTLVSSLHGQKVFPVMAVEMIGVGEESGNINEMLEQVAKTYDDEVKNSLGVAMALFEPLLILTMVVIIGILAVAVLLPLVNLNAQF